MKHKQSGLNGHWNRSHDHHHRGHRIMGWSPSPLSEEILKIHGKQQEINDHVEERVIMMSIMILISIVIAIITAIIFNFRGSLNGSLDHLPPPPPPPPPGHDYSSSSH